MATVYSDPDGDSAPLSWSSTGAAHYTELDEGIRQPTTPTLTDYISDASDIAEDRFTMSNADIEAGTASSIVVWAFAGEPNDMGNVLYVKVSVDNGSTWLTELSAGLSAAAWLSFTWNGSWNQTQINNMMVHLRNEGDLNQTTTCYAFYAIITYTAGGPTDYPRSAAAGVGAAASGVSLYNAVRAAGAGVGAAAGGVSIYGAVRGAAAGVGAGGAAAQSAGRVRAATAGIGAEALAVQLVAYTRATAAGVGVGAIGSIQRDIPRAAAAGVGVEAIAVSYVGSGGSTTVWNVTEAGVTSVWTVTQAGTTSTWVVTEAGTGSSWTVKELA